MKNRKGIKLTLKDCQEALNKEIRVAFDVNHSVSKEFAFHVWSNEYRIYKNGEMVECGQALEELIEDYNAL